MSRLEALRIAAVAALAFLSVPIGASAAPPSGAGGQSWVANGANACDKYLSVDFVTAVLTHPRGKSKPLSPQACTYTADDDSGSIQITLTPRSAM